MKYTHEMTDLKIIKTCEMNDKMIFVYDDVATLLVIPDLLIAVIA